MEPNLTTMQTVYAGWCTSRQRETNVTQFRCLEHRMYVYVLYFRSFNALFHARRFHTFHGAILLRARSSSYFHNSEVNKVERDFWWLPDQRKIKPFVFWVTYIQLDLLMNRMEQIMSFSSIIFIRREYSRTWYNSSFYLAFCALAKRSFFLNCSFGRASRLHEENKRQTQLSPNGRRNLKKGRTEKKKKKKIMYVNQAKL